MAVDFDERWRLHLLKFRQGKHHNKHMQRAWNKYGEKSFEFFILEFTDDVAEREKYWIEKLDATNHQRGYNICKFGTSRIGVKASYETRQKLSISHLGYKASEETKAKHRINMTGNQFNKGRVWAPETIAKRIASNTGKKRTPEQIARMKAGRGIRKPISKETREKMQLAKLGRKHTEEAKANMRGHIISEETRKKLSLAASAQWRMQKSVAANDGSLDYTSDMWV